MLTNNRPTAGKRRPGADNQQPGLAPPGRWALVRQYSLAFIPPLLTFLLVIGLWEAVVWLFAIPLFLLPPPSGIIEAFLARPGFLVGIGLNTFQQAFTGFLIGCGAGALVAALCVRWRILADGLVPFSIAANAIPIVALSPILGVWLGSTNPASKIGVVAILTFFPTLVSVYRGLISPSVDAIQLLHSYAAPQRDVFLKLRVPMSLPYLFNALKICSTLAMIGTVVAEFFGGTQNSLGVYIKSQAGILRTREAWSAILVACVLGILFYLAINLLERIVMPWYRERSR